MPSAKTAEQKTAWDGKQAALTEAQLKAVNSAITADKVSGYDAHVANTDIHVTTADKAKLTQSINEAASVKASEIYKLSSSTAKAAYDKAITDGAIVNNNASATIGQVNEAESAITSAKAKLNGAKIAVANLNSLTPDEVTAIVKAVANANNVPESAIQFSNNNTTLSIVTNGYTQSLNINDYAVQNSAINR